MIKKRIYLIVIIFLTALPFGSPFLCARDNPAAAGVCKTIEEARTPADRIAAFEKLKDEYFPDNRYDEFIRLIKSFSQGDKKQALYVNYYTALARYEQLAYLEKEQKWDEYFDQGNEYKTDIENNARQAVESVQPKDPLNIYGRVLLWRFHREQQGVSHQQEFQELLKTIQEYAQNSQDMAPLKHAGDVILSYGETAKAEEVYRLYAEKLARTSGGAEEVRKFARRVYGDGNFEFAQVLYTAYIDNIVKEYPLEQVIADLNDIAGLFLIRKDSIPYAVKVYDKIEEVGGNAVFTESMLLQRAFALVKAKEYLRAKDVYQDFIKKYPCSGHYDEALFKLGIIYIYILRDIDKGKLCFEQVVQKKDSISLKECGEESLKTTPWSISSFYQLGLLAQWDKELTKAKEYYTQLLEKAKNGFRDTVELSHERLKEIGEGNQIEYGLKMFLDVSLKPENERYDMSRVDLNSPVVRGKNKEPVKVFSNYALSDTGSMQSDVQYLWSGNIGTKKSSFEESVLDTSYDYSGTKEINLVVVSPQGVLDRSIYLLDIEK
ncbi:MAG: tetratricopeptide repeat protein [Candidatus Omnitrophota bacterium]|jgi:TolA-binding protein